ncbi:hypothetical protein CHGG_02506 [Chaetomium globosum CBS 148.51]|uniref:Protein farnesyltransferase/geranylgeranyltransferase type-1 subunit alpha n=1 Tax=Chaetomium globosum (strain ATCC 6205 / CBS 148.51 / DSM 1962 / NBRC 6347 / NRRL 1970) TaxID=306901 RepID=Q2HB98_CHAGB|nr:uncharacterized protein CHGG_02506 [Chaetomium globosum CBS 148.51]EAQ90571.1 hypothetical protein CHGG_02506 [Chaetomium globosum CBS 148.51]
MPGQRQRSEQDQSVRNHHRHHPPPPPPPPPPTTTKTPPPQQPRPKPSSLAPKRATPPPGPTKPASARKEAARSPRSPTRNKPPGWPRASRPASPPVRALASSSTAAASSGAVAKLACGGGVKTLKEVWKVVNEGGVALRVARVKKGDKGVGAGVREYEAKWERKVVLGCLEVESRCFRTRRERERKGELEVLTGEPVVVTEQEVFEETRRRKEMAALKKELYGGGVGKEGKLAMDPEWDDVEPVVLEEPEGALAAISYSADYAEAMAYLRAVMQAKEHSPRCLRLTEHIISMNPAHYTVWLFRAANVFALKLPIPDEMEWLNGVALENLKNYQIWHHRHLLVENYHPIIAGDPDAIASFAAKERNFLQQILAEDTKNYHVWSYRSYLVGKFNLFNDGEELAAMEAMIDDDVRNNSAWSHRFFLVFSNPDYATPGSAATEADPGVPAAVIDREVEYAQEKIRLAPQNQSGWNYLRGVLVKGGRKLATVEEFASGFVKGLGEGEEAEDVQSTHALDLLAEIYAEKGDKEKAELSLSRLGQKWDRIRVGYWEWRRKCLEVPAQG